MSEDQVKELIRNRGTLKAKLTNLEKFLDNVKASTSDDKAIATQIELRFQNNNTLLSEFDKVQTRIESICSENELNLQYGERYCFENRYFQLQSLLVHYQDNVKSVSATSISDGQPIPSHGTSYGDPLENILLPKLKLPTFGGEFSQWLTFKTSFVSIIDSHPKLNDNQKFQFLKASLENYALRLIEGLESVTNPYEEAWHILCDRFDKKQFLLNTHFKSLLSIQPLQKDIYPLFRQMLDEISKQLNALDAMQLSKETLYEYLIIHILSSKLDKLTLKNWKELKYKSDVPTLNEFLNFLKAKVDLLHSLNDSYSNSSQFSGVPSYKKPSYTSKSSESQVHLAVNTFWAMLLLQRKPFYL